MIQTLNSVYFFSILFLIKGMFSCFKMMNRTILNLKDLLELTVTIISIDPKMAWMILDIFFWSTIREIFSFSMLNWSIVIIAYIWVVSMVNIVNLMNISPKFFRLNIKVLIFELRDHLWARGKEIFVDIFGNIST